MATCTNEHITFINRLTGEKDQLIAEKDRLVVEKDRLRRELHHIIRDRDVQIELLKRANHSGARVGGTGNYPEEYDLRRETKMLRDRNRVLEEALRDFVNREEQIMGDDEEEDGLIEMDGFDVKDDPATTDDVGFGRRFDDTLSPSQPPAHASKPMPSGVDGSTNFKFVPLIITSATGACEFGDINSVAQVVHQSIQKQLEVLSQRHSDGKCRSAPGTVFQSRGCMCKWMHNIGSETRWTVDARRSFACASCFNACRACLFWVGNMKWTILPLPLIVKGSQATWKDAAY